MGRVAITGMGTVNPVALDLVEYEKALREMHIGIDRISRYDPSEETVQIAAEIKGFDASVYMDRKKARRYDPVIRYAVAAARMALEDAELEKSGSWRKEAAVTVSTGIGGFHSLFEELKTFQKHGTKYVSPFLIPMTLPDMSAGAIAMEFGIQGPNFATISACATSLHSIIVTAMLILHDYIQIGVCGGAEALITPLSVAAFANMMALSRNNATPKEACRPFDEKRDGFVMGEGAGVLVLEDETHAKSRGARIYGYIDGFGMSGDAYDYSAIEPGGEAVSRAMIKAVTMAGRTIDEIDLINCHATSTPTGDRAELEALQVCYQHAKNRPILQSTKGFIGHGIGSAGGNEVIACVLQGCGGFIHGTANLDNPDPKAEGFCIPSQTIQKSSSLILKNSLGFGGHNASLLLTIP